jgi:hypothetical protein
MDLAYRPLTMQDAATRKKRNSPERKNGKHKITKQLRRNVITCLYSQSVT